MARTPAVEKLPDSAKQIIYQEKADEASFEEIKDKLNDIYDADLSYEAVRMWWNNHSDDIRADITEDNLGKLKEEQMKDLLDSAGQLKKINDKINEAIDNLNSDRREDMKMLRELSGEIRQQLKFQREYVEKVTESTEIQNVEEMNVEQNYNAIEINQQFNEYIRELEDDGVIKIEQPDKLSV